MTVYSAKFQDNAAVERYFRKFDNRIDRLRHAIEIAALAPHAAGSLFDCTIGIGRFIGQLPKVTAYTGMDLSPEFVAYVNGKFPGVGATTGDLTQGIQRPAEEYDTVLCLRSLSAIGHVPEVLAEMVRVTRPGGKIVFDYGRKPTEVDMGGKLVLVDDAPVDEILRTLPVEVVERVRLDAVLTRAKRRRRVFRALHHPMGRAIPDGLLLAMEHALRPLGWERQMIVARKLDS